MGLAAMLGATLAEWQKKREEAAERRAFAKSEQAANAIPSKPAVVEKKKPLS
jgi:hypothetical protein